MHAHTDTPGDSDGVRHPKYPHPDALQGRSVKPRPSSRAPYRIHTRPSLHTPYRLPPSCPSLPLSLSPIVKASRIYTAECERTQTSAPVCV